MTIPVGLIDRLSAIVGPRHCLTEAGDRAPYLEEERGLYRSDSPVVIRPKDTREVAEVVAACAKAGVSVVPQGGNTGLCGGAVGGAREVLLNLGRLKRVRAVDPVNYTMTVEAGCVLADLQKAAAAENCLFPLSLGAEGSCQIGGNLATNAGGVNVLRYGNARDLVLGLEVVLPDGRVWNGLRALGKDNTGYCLRHLFVGSEGTLGVITAAVLKLFPAIGEKQTALCAIDDLDNVLHLLSRARRISGDAVNAFELIPRLGLEFVVRHSAGASDHFDAPHPWYALIEFATSKQNASLREDFETLLSEVFEEGIITDAVIAESLEQAEGLWRLRESLPEAQKHEGGSIKHDVAVPVSLVPEFLRQATAAVAAALPGIRPCPFGHVGDGNIHFNLSQPEGMDKAAFLSRWEEVNRIVHDIVVAMGGSISAEHGIGRLKVAEMEHYKDPVELDLMRRIKAALDPQGLMNPGKVVRL